MTQQVNLKRIAKKRKRRQNGKRNTGKSEIGIKKHKGWKMNKH